MRNLSSCVKVALDFVSPENAHRCVQLTDQFAKLPRGHHLSEDKLQVKTMLLHALHHISDALLRTGAAAKASVEIANAERAATARAEALKAARQASRQLYAAKRKAAKEAELAAAANAEGSVAEGTVEERVAAAVAASAVEAALDAVFGADAADEVDPQGRRHERNSAADVAQLRFRVGRQGEHEGDEGQHSRRHQAAHPRVVSLNATGTNP